MWTWRGARHLYVWPTGSYVRVLAGGVTAHQVAGTRSLVLPHGVAKADRQGCIIVPVEMTYPLMLFMNDPCYCVPCRWNFRVSAAPGSSCTEHDESVDH
jgi:hypothetical protein